MQNSICDSALDRRRSPRQQLMTAAEVLMPLPAPELALIVRGETNDQSSGGLCFICTEKLPPGQVFVSIGGPESEMAFRAGEIVAVERQMTDWRYHVRFHPLDDDE